jgi:hypothetical protein
MEKPLSFVKEFFLFAASFLVGINVDNVPEGAKLPVFICTLIDSCHGDMNGGMISIWDTTR